MSFELHKKFEGMVFQDLYELSERASQFESILKEEGFQKSTALGSYYLETSPTEVEVDVAEYMKGGPIMCDQLVKKNAHALASLKT